jgi:predicted DNA-binding transcriptional regulator AlpA
VSADQINLLDEIRLLDRKTVADALGVAAETLDEWVRAKSFPQPIQCVSGGPKRWRFAVIKAWIEKRQRSRYVPPKARGALMRGETLKRRRTGGK